MTLRKSAHGGGAQGPGSLPFPVTSTSPIRPSSHAPHTNSFSGKATLIVSDHESQDQGKDVRRAEGILPQEPPTGQPPRTRSIGGATMDAATTFQSDTLPPSLQISQPLITPRSSFESQPSSSFVSSEVPETNMNDPQRGSAPVRSNSNNPFMRNIRDGPLPQANQTSTANIWADKPETFDSDYYAERHPSEPAPSRCQALDRVILTASSGWHSF